MSTCTMIIMTILDSYSTYVCLKPSGYFVVDNVNVVVLSKYKHTCIHYCIINYT